MTKRGKKNIRISFRTILLIIILILIVLFFVSCSVLIFGEEPSPSGNTALINIRGTITVDGNTGIGKSGTSSTEIVKYIERADKSSSIKAILFDINSPGGSAVASKEIADAVKKAKKPCYSVIREIGTSGAYWIASASDKVIASEVSVTGSIGAIASYLEFSGLLKRYNISYQRLVSGDYKDMGSPFKDLTSNERAILKEKLAKIHEYFVLDIAKNRNISVEEIRKIATGEFYLGSEALELGLIDATGDRQTALNMIKKELNLTKVKLAQYKRPRTFIDILAGVFSEQFFFMGRGIGDAVINSGITNKIDIII